MREPDKSRKSAWWRVRAGLGRDLVGDEDGGVLVYMTILIPVMLGIIGLAVDGSRLYILNSEQSDLADAAALAAARELDRTEDGVTAAADAAHNVVTNDPRWASDDEPEFHIASVLFCPDQTCSTTMDLEDARDDPVEARFVQVIAEMRLVTPSFLMAVGAVSQAQSNAIAVAGASMVACNVTPLMMCNTFDESDFYPGVMFELKGDNQLGPGAFSLIDPAGMTSSGNNLTTRLLASTSPNFCYVNDVSVATGSRVAAIQQGLNVRFDLYPNGNTGLELAALYPPAPNVTKGQRFTAQGAVNCRFDSVTGANELMAMPLDNCYPNCPLAGPGRNSRIGDGNWNRGAYWTANHSTKTQPPGWSTFTRYQTYIWELDLNVDGEPQYTNMPSRAGAQENPQPQCYFRKPDTEAEAGDIDRRSLYVAVTDCSGISGNSTPDLESGRYGEFFLIRPSDGGEILAEFVRWIEPDDDTGKLRRIVQLYR